eukprot:Hpha_TRINITY_DN12200_c0_g1::TRINITY_DN12200_c0_g1_i1::g.16975::m.16975
MFGGLADLFNEDPEECEARAYGGHSEEEYEDNAIQAIQAEVIMISGCQDKQTSADVGDVGRFGLPDDAGPGGAGGACTNALLTTTYKPGDVSWIELLDSMQKFLKGRGYSQVPQLSTSRRCDLNDPFEMCGGYGGSKKSLLIGINYIGHSSGVLSGCINDVCSMKEYICESEGFPDDEDSMRVLVDDPYDQNVQDYIPIRTDQPTRANIMDSLQWLVDGAQPGDVLFLHYSGHGSQVRDRTGDEEDGKDETLCPTDYSSAGMITDDEIYQIIVAPLPPGVRLIALMDCCHSGTILDLPFAFSATEQHMADVHAGKPAKTYANPGFSSAIKKLAKHGFTSEGVMGFMQTFL